MALRWKWLNAIIIMTKKTNTKEREAIIRGESLVKVPEQKQESSGMGAVSKHGSYGLYLFIFIFFYYRFYMKIIIFFIFKF